MSGGSSGWAAGSSPTRSWRRPIAVRRRRWPPRLAAWPGRWYWSDQAQGHLVLVRPLAPDRRERWWVHALLLCPHGALRPRRRAGAGSASRCLPPDRSAGRCDSRKRSATAAGAPCRPDGHSRSRSSASCSSTSSATTSPRTGTPSTLRRPISFRYPPTLSPIGEPRRLSPAPLSGARPPAAARRRRRRSAGGVRRHPARARVGIRGVGADGARDSSRCAPS